MFCHLHCHNEVSYLDGYGSSKAFAQRAKELGFTHLALTNHGNIDGLIEFQRACQKEGIIPIHGCELYIVPDELHKEKNDKRGHITVLVKNETGWRNLCQMLTIANMDGFYYRPRIGFRNFLERCEGLVVLTGCTATFLDIGNAMDFFSELLCKLPGDIYLEVMPHNMESQAKLNSDLSVLSVEASLPLVATNDCHYILPSDKVAQEVLLAIQTKAKWSDKDRYRFNIDGLHLRSRNEMIRAFKLQRALNDTDIEAALNNTMEIAKKCEGFHIEKKKISLPSLPGKEGVNPGEFIWGLAEKRLLEISKGWPTEKVNQYFDRLSEEWKLINEKEFSGYFMIVWELIDWCKQNNIMTGPGRGSSGGSLLAFLLGVTSVDPIKYNLLFSRFIAEDRTDYPDIDMDFEDRKRHLIREHLEALYGKEHISSLSTFMTMKSRGCIRDVCRVFDIPPKKVDALAKSVREGNEEESAIAEALNGNENGGAEFKKEYPEVCNIILKLEGQCRGAGQHASALIVSKENLRDGTRCNLAMRKDEIVANWDMQDSEHVGLMKLDILGLNTLSVLSEAKRLIANPDFEYEKIPLDDQAIYEDLYGGNTTGVFQLSAWATTNLAKQIRATNIGELSDIIALVRPGPLDSGMTEDYIKRKNDGLQWKKKHQKYEDIVKDTFGIIVYQEQVMEVIHKVAGLPYSTADKIRKIVAKKRDAKEFQQYEDAFIKGCRQQKTFSVSEAKEFWEALQKHARYSFNKSHSTAYAIIGYWTAWVKHYYPVEFICAALTYGSESKKEDLIEEARRIGLNVVTPKIGISDAMIWSVKDGKLYAPFIEIKGFGESMAKKCSEIRKKVFTANHGFFWPSQKEGIIPAGSGKMEKLLHEAGCYDENEKFNPELFSFKTEQNTSKSLSELFGDDPRLRTLSVETFPFNVIKRKSFVDKKSLNHCHDCELRDECKAPVHPSPGYFNLAIIGEAPGIDENDQGKGFVGRSGKLLWDEMIKYELQRIDFHVTNAVKCWPSKSKTPTQKQIMICKKWLIGELREIECRLVLAFGNTGLKLFAGKESGITKLNGTTEWCEEISAWVCYCIHPAAALRDQRPGQQSNLDLFREGIKNFTDKIALLYKD